MRRARAKPRWRPAIVSRSSDFAPSCVYSTPGWEAWIPGRTRRSRSALISPGVAMVASTLAVTFTARRRSTLLIDASGDGATHPLNGPRGVALDRTGTGNVYVTSDPENTVFRITPAGAITAILTGSGDGQGNGVDSPHGVVVDLTAQVVVPSQNDWTDLVVTYEILTDVDDDFTDVAPCNLTLGEPPVANGLLKEDQQKPTHQ